MLLDQLLRVGATAESLAVEDVFAAALYTGTGSTRSITTGLDLSSGQGLIWLKSRSAATDHALYDTVRGATKDLKTGATGATAQTTQSTGLTAFNSNGFSIGSLAKLNTNAETYAAWTFKKAAKFFGVVTYTGNDVDGRQIAHSLGCVPGMIIVKAYDQAVGWYVYHRGFTSASYYALLNSTSSQASASTMWSSTAPTETHFTIGTSSGVNATGYNYVAYLFAHDDSADGVVQCGSFTTDSSGNATVTLGWEPQFILWKPSSATGSWYLTDTMRNLNATALNKPYAKSLAAESASAESNFVVAGLTATGFSVSGWSASTTYVYLAIRRGPMRVPTDATEVYYAENTARASLIETTSVPFPPDAFWTRGRSGTDTAWLNVLGSRLCSMGLPTNTFTNASQGRGMMPYSTDAEETSTPYYHLKADGKNITKGTDWSNATSYGDWIHHFFRRAPGFFDVVCYTGTGVARTVAHGLGSAPGMMVVKARSPSGYGWAVYHKSLGAGQYIFINATGAAGTASTFWNGTTPTATFFSLGTHGQINYNTGTYVAHLFGDTPGLCKAFSYTGNGTNQDIALGLAPRFVILKRTDSTGNWMTFDTVRGIVAGSDPALCLNLTAAELTGYDIVDPISNGINVIYRGDMNENNEVNTNNATYVGWACA